MPKGDKIKHTGKREDQARPASATVDTANGGASPARSSRARTGDAAADKAGTPAGQARPAKQPDTPCKRNAHSRSKNMSERQDEHSQHQRELAYYLWQQAGSPEGRQDEFWHLAGHQLEQDDLAADAAVDAAEEDSFPASDPVNHT